MATVKHPAREECRGCIWCGKGTHCTDMALRWVWHEFVLESQTLSQILKDCAKSCEMKEAEVHDV